MGFFPDALRRLIRGMGVPASGVLTVSADGQSVSYREELRFGPIVLGLCLMLGGFLLFSQGEAQLPPSAALFPVPFFALVLAVFTGIGLFVLKRARKSLAGGAF